MDYNNVQMFDRLIANTLRTISSSYMGVEKIKTENCDAQVFYILKR
jgi:hypothetical protein